MVKSKAIPGLQDTDPPTEPTWTEEPAVINYGDKQHFSGRSLYIRGFLRPKISQNQKRSAMTDDEYMIERLERVIELIKDGNYHMAIAKLLADISALKNEKEE